MQRFILAFVAVMTILAGSAYAADQVGQANCAPGKTGCFSASPSQPPNHKPQSQHPSATSSCKVPGLWADSYGGYITVKNNLTGTFKLPYCGSSHSFTIKVKGNSFSLHADWSGGTECQGFTEDMTFGSSCNVATGTWVNDNGNANGDDTWTRTSATISLSRPSLTVMEANGQPDSGTFTYTTDQISGFYFAKPSFEFGVTATTNPNTIDLIAPTGTGAPALNGGLEKIIATYTVDGETASQTVQVADFGMSCYIIALESDYGTPPNACKSDTIYGIHYSGTMNNPYGLPGTYCSLFIGNVKLQGTAQLNDGQYVHWNGKAISVITHVTGSDNTPLVAGQTVARDPAIIPAKVVLIDIDKIGIGLLANDSGGAIKKYRLDLFNGAGKAACASFTNPICVSACEQAQPLCPSTALSGE